MLKTVLTISLILCSSNVFASELKFTEGYKNAIWGMNRDSVKKAFKDMNFLDGSGYIYFLTTLGEDKAAIAFVFVEEMLCRAAIAFDIKTSNQMVYLDKFKFYEELLIKKYGAPKNKGRNVDSEYSANEAMAISTGKGSYFDLWETNESRIALSLTGDNYDLLLRIVYESIQLEKKGSEIAEKNALDNL